MKIGRLTATTNTTSTKNIMCFVSVILKSQCQISIQNDIEILNMKRAKKSKMYHGAAALK